MAKDDDAYEVGYGKPPKHTQFSPGQSGNIHGRPKRSKNLRTLLLEELEEPIAIQENGKTRTISKGEGLVKRNVAKGVNGDNRATEMIYKYGMNVELPEPKKSMAQLSAEDEAILKRFLPDYQEPEPPTPAIPSKKKKTRIKLTEENL